MLKGEIDFILCQTNFKDIPFDKYQKDFSFIVDGKKHFTSRIIADILSPKIRNLHYTDESIDEFYINTDKSSSEMVGEDYFEEFLQLCTFDNKKLNPEFQELFSQYFYKLGNIDEYFRIQSDFLALLTPENAIDRLLKVQKIANSNSDEFNHQQDFMQKLISFIASHFEEFDKENLKRLSIDFIEEIIQADSLKIADEDSLLQFLIEVYEENPSCSFLFENVIFSNVTEKVLKEFINVFSIENLNSQIWSSICRRLFKSKLKNKLNCKPSRYIEKVPNFKEFKPGEGNEFNGIMRYLTEKTGGNIHVNNTIEITSNSYCIHPMNLVDYESDNIFHSKNEKDIFICFDFKDKLVQVSSYSIKSHPYGPNNGHLANWVIEVSKDGSNWEEIDRHYDDQTLNNSNVIATFDVSNEKNDFYQFVRLKQTGYSWNGYPNSNSYLFYFYFIEFFGKLIEPNEN